MKYCSKCRQDKPIEEWTKTGAYCKQCVRNYNKEYRDRQKIKTGWIPQRIINNEPGIRTCNGCFKKFPVTDFRWRIKDVARANDCNDCHKQRNRIYSRQPHIRERAKKYKELKRKRYKFKLYTYLLNHPCVDCGIVNPCFMHFDHIDPKTKSGNISNINEKLDWELTLTEIAKCEVRCANCHSIKTSSDNNSQFFKWWYGIESVSDIIDDLDCE